MPETSTGLPVLPCPVPPMLEAAIGYEGDARLVAFFFDVGDEAYAADGRVTTCGEWDAYRLYITHPLVAPHLCGYHLGSSEESPASYLLLDRQARTLSVAPVAEAQRLLSEQWGGCEQPEPLLVVNEQEWEQLVEELIAQRPRFTSAQLREHWQAHRHLVEQLTVWLMEQWEVAS